MRRALLALTVFAAGWPALGATPKELLGRWLSGPSKAFQGRQTATAYSEGGPIAGEVLVQGDGDGRTRREYTSGGAKGSVVLQTPVGTWRKNATDGWTHLPSAPPSGAASRAKRIEGHYTVASGPPVRIAGRSAVPLTITARQAYNPSRRLWLDPVTGLALKDVSLAPGGRTRSTSTYTSVGYGPQPASAFRPPASAGLESAYGPGSFQPVASRAEVERRSGRTAPAPTHVPAGYAVETWGLMRTRRGDAMPGVRYSDGLSAFTVFRRHSAGEGSQGRGRGGPRYRGGRPDAGQRPHQFASTLQQSVVSVESPSGSYLLVGDLAESELRRIADSLP